MDKYLVRKDVYDEILKAMRDRSHLVQKPITDKNGHQRKVWVRAGEEPTQQKTKKIEEPTEKKTAKPKFKTGSTVTLDGAKGDFKVSSIDKDGAYHVVSADGKKGYKVSENHITGNSSATNAESGKSKEEQIKDLQVQIMNARSDMSIWGDIKAAELTKKLKALQNDSGETEKPEEKKKVEEKKETKTVKKEKDPEIAFSQMEVAHEKKRARESKKLIPENLKYKDVENKYREASAKVDELKAKKKKLIQENKQQEAVKVHTEMLNAMYDKDLNEYLMNQAKDNPFYDDFLAKNSVAPVDHRAEFKGKDYEDEVGRSMFGDKWGKTKQLEPTYGRKQIPANQFVAAEYKKTYDDDKIDTTYAGIEEALRQAQELPAIKKHPEFMLRLRNDLAKAEKEPETVTKYRTSGEGAEAVYTPERTKLHNKIIDKLIQEKLEAAKPKEGEAPTFQILGGRGGSGKSTFNKKKSDSGVYNEDNVIVVDPDALKQELANESGDGWEGWKAKAYHEESSDVSKILMKRAMTLGLNIVMDITMSNADKQIDELKMAKSLGYKTGAYYMHVPKQESFKRAMKRYLESETQKGVEDYSGRLVPPDVLLGMTGNEANFDKVKEFADDWSFYDNFIPFEKDPNTGKNKYKAEKIAQKGE